MSSEIGTEKRDEYEINNYEARVDLEFPDLAIDDSGLKIKEVGSQETLGENTINSKLFFTKVNGAKVNQAKQDAFINLDNLVDNKYYKGCFCTLEDGDKLGNFFDRLPYGIINKKITGIGATTLELKSERNSILVLPTKALAYGKYKAKREQDGENSCMYVGSPIGEIQSDVTWQKILDYLNLDDGRYKKFLVVADSLPKVLRVIGREHYNDFFLMIDEIDTLQIDNTYRPALENVIDYYAQFKETNRAAVSATLRRFTHPVLLDETIITTDYKETPTRDIILKHTNNEDYCTVDTIKGILEKQDGNKILIAYNSMDGILVCIKLLLHELGDDWSSRIGILCSETSKDKAGECYTEIDENGRLQKQIVFMTCAYFVGVDINEPCHVISVSTFNQPFTLLSTEKMAQIVGRCRVGVLSETIIYETKGFAAEDDLETYRDKLLKKADVLSRAVKAFKETLETVPELVNAVDYVEYLVEYVGVEKVANDYPISLLRESIEGQIVPSYFNIDALLERWELHYFLYSDKDVLVEKLRTQGHHIEEIPLYHDYTEEQKEILGLVKQDKAEKLRQALQEAKQNLLELDEESNSQLRAIKLQEYIRHSPKQLQKFYLNFQKFSPYYPTEYLVDLLIEYHSADEREYKTFINSLVLWTLDDNHPFKVLMLNEFNCEPDGTVRMQITSNIRDEKMRKVCDVYFPNYPMKQNAIFMLFRSFFKFGSTKKYYRIIGLNPMGFQEPMAKITNHEYQALLDLLILR